MRMNYGRRGCDKLVYDGVALSDTFEVVDIALPLLPTISAVTLDVAHKPGSYFASRKISTRNVNVKLRLDAGSRCPLDIFDAWLSVSSQISKSEPKRLDIGNGKRVYALLTGDTAIDNKATYGEVDCTFTCFDPYVYGASHSYDIAQTIAFDVMGGVCAFPTIEAVATGSVVKVTNMKTGDYVRIPSVASGKKLTIDMEKEAVRDKDGIYVPVDLASDFFYVEDASELRFEGCTGTLSYEERYL